MDEISAENLVLKTIESSPNPGLNLDEIICNVLKDNFTINFSLAGIESALENLEANKKITQIDNKYYSVQRNS